MNFLTLLLGLSVQYNLNLPKEKNNNIAAK